MNATPVIAICLLFATATPNSRAFKYTPNGAPGGNVNAAHHPRFRAVEPFSQFGVRPLKSLSATQSGSIWTVRATVTDILGTKHHGLEKGEAVIIIFAGPYGGPRSTLLNGNFNITDIGVDADGFGWFEYELTQDPGSTTDTTFAPGWYARIWRSDSYVIENNIIELNIRKLVSGGDVPRGIFMYVGYRPPQYVLRQFLARNNIIRNVDNRSDPVKDINTNLLGLGMEIQGISGLHGVEQALLQNNIVRLDRDNIPGLLGSILYQGAGIVAATFDNNSADGHLLLAKDTFNVGVVAADVTSQVRAKNEEIETLSLLK